MLKLYKEGINSSYCSSVPLGITECSPWSHNNVSSEEPIRTICETFTSNATELRKSLSLCLPSLPGSCSTLWSLRCFISVATYLFHSWSQCSFSKRPLPPLSHDSQDAPLCWNVQSRWGGTVFQLKLEVWKQHWETPCEAVPLSVSRKITLQENQCSFWWKSGGKGFALVLNSLP